ncbi:hypothetical protein [Pseudobutyrivibrio ruminis]|uniref:O-antigen ligase n=1 Tax=Pseudobutyrivibrio ruminis DSM 9787 TaxID=1123011 RepID=A0A285S8X2_9FIRM|nr:hypothetical protein [Pseudobutyrivibrio ruminis]SOC04042.1 hypothetical protein SAMN02910411_1998 [Pseudobutyrivibrio ruminis DSM 9787]
MESIFKIFEKKKFEMAFIYAALFMYGLMYNLIPTAAMMYMLIAVVVIDCLVFGAGHLHVDFNFLFLTGFSVMMLSYDEFTMPNIPAWRSSWHYVLIFPLSYLAGKIIVNISNDKYETISKNALIAMGSGFCVQTLLNYSMNYTTGAMDTETWPSFFENEMFSRNNYEYGFFFVTTALIYVLIERKKNKALATIVVILNILIQYLGVRWEGRLNAGILIIELGLMIPIYLFNQTKAKNRNYKKILIAVLIGIIAIALLIAGAFNFNWFGFRDLYMHSYWMGTGGVFHNVRFALMREGIENSAKYPLGGWTSVIHNSGSTHNAYLEWSRNYGIVPWILIEIFRMISLVQVLRLTINRNSKGNIRYWLLPLWIALNIYLSFDPAGFYRRYNWVPFLMLAGMIYELHIREDVSLIKLSKRLELQKNNFDLAFFFLSIGCLVSAYYALKVGQIDFMYAFMVLPVGYGFGMTLNKKVSVILIVVGLIVNGIKTHAILPIMLMPGGIGGWLHLQRQVVELVLGEYPQGFIHDLAEDGSMYSFLSEIAKYYGVIPWFFMVIMAGLFIGMIGILFSNKNKSVGDCIIVIGGIVAIGFLLISGNTVYMKSMLGILGIIMGILSRTLSGIHNKNRSYGRNSE